MTCICANCGKQFSRNYTLAIERRSKPQFCCKECVAQKRRSLSNAGAEARFWSHVEKRGPSECWEWTAGNDNKGYGQFSWQRDGRRTHKASRLAYEFAHGSPAGEMHVLHRCDNPGCCNPEHLFLGTHKDNMEDMAKKGRRVNGPYPLGENAHKAKLTREQVVSIRASAAGNADLAKEYGVSTAAIYNIRHQKTWKHV